MFSSSAAVYGNPRLVPIDENHQKDPVNSYGETKLMFERVLRWYAAAYDWTVAAFRYFNASGATADAGENHRPETHIIPLLLEAATGERPHFEIYGDDYHTPDGNVHSRLRSRLRYRISTPAGPRYARASWYGGLQHRHRAGIFSARGDP